MTTPNILPSPSSSNNTHTNTNPSPDNAYGSGEGVNWLGQLGLNQRVGELRKTSTQGVPGWLNFGGRNHTEPDPPSFSATQISAMIADNIMRESKRLRTQLLHVSSPAPSVTNDNDLAVVDNTDDDDTDHHDDHDHDRDGAGAGGRKKARSMVQAHLLLASAASPKMKVGSGDDYEGVLRGHQHVHASSPIGGERFVNIQNISRSLPVPNDNNAYAYAYNPVVIGDNSNHSQENLVQLHPLLAHPISQTTFTADNLSAGNSHLLNPGIDINNPVVVAAVAAANDGVKVNNISEEGDDEDDGRIHSVPYRKNGPYTCPKCNREFATSQCFASHVSASHYKYETEAQRKKRIMAKIRKRNLRLQKVSDGLTFVPVSSKPAGNRNTGAFAQPATAGPAVKFEVDGVAAPGNQARANAYTGVKVKLEPDA